MSNGPYMEPVEHQGLQGLCKGGSWNPMVLPSPLHATSSMPTNSRNFGTHNIPLHINTASPKTTTCRKSPEPIFKLCESNKHEIQLAFELFDARKVGKLCYRDMKVAMRALECHVKKAEVLQLMQKYSKDDSNEIGSNEFMHIMMSKYKDKDPDLTINKAYAIFDADGKGKISIKNVRKVTRELGENFTDEQLEAMITGFDKDKDGEVTASEFFDIMKKHERLY